MDKPLILPTKVILIIYLISFYLFLSCNDAKEYSLNESTFYKNYRRGSSSTHLEKPPGKLFPGLTRPKGSDIFSYHVKKFGSDSYMAITPNHSFSTIFDGNGINVRPLSLKTSNWQVRMNLVGMGYEQNVKPVASPKFKVDSNHIEYGRNTIKEWYLNGPDGLEQGFTIDTVPSSDAKDQKLVLKLEYSSDLIPVVKENGKRIDWKTEEGTTVFNYSKLYAYDSLGKELPSSLNASGDHISIIIDDYGANYPITVDPIMILETKIRTASDPNILANYGRSVAISGDTAVVGAPGNDTNGDSSGAAYVLSRDIGGTNNWGELIKLTPVGAQPCDLFGFSVDISGDTIVVGAPTLTTSTCPARQGSTYVFERNQGGPDNWGQVAVLSASDGTTGNQFGYSMSIDVDVVFVGAPGDSGGTGAAYVYGRNMGGADNWGEVRKVIGSDSVLEDVFGFSVSVNGDTAVLGAPAHFASDVPVTGAAYVVQKDEGGSDNWGEVKKIVPSDVAEGDVFGFSVSISGDTVAIGAGADDDDVTMLVDIGSLYFFERNQGGADNWGQTAKRTAPDADEGDALGSSVSIDADRTITGAPGDDDGGSKSGASYITERSLSLWGGLEKITASDAGPGTGVLFGLGVFEIDDVTNDRSIVSDSTTGTGGLFLEPEGLAIENVGQPNESILVVDKGLPGIWRVDPTTGNRSVAYNNSGNPSIPFILPIDIDIKSNGNLVVTDPGSAIVMEITSSGNKSILNDISGTPALGFPFSRVVESNDNVVVTDLDFIESVGVGNDVCFDCFLDPDCIPPDCCAFLTCDQEIVSYPAVVRINSTNGQATPLADTSSCISGRPFNRPLGITLLNNNNFAVAAIDLNESTAVIEDVAVLEINSTSGACSILSDNTNTGPTLQFPEGIATLPSGDLAVVDNFQKQVISIDSSTGNRAILSGGVVGSGPPFVEPFWIAIDGDGDPVVSDQGSTGTVFGTSVDISGNNAIIGAPGKSNFEGAVYIFQFCEQASPAVSVSPANQAGSSGDTLNYTVSVENMSTAACSSTTFTMSATVPEGWSSSFTPPSMNLNSGETANASWNVSSNAQTPEDTYEIIASAQNSDEPAFGNSANAIYTVNNSPSLCGNGVCDSGEDCSSCSADCVSGAGASCGNGVCEAGGGEDCLSCPQDCRGKQTGKPSARYCCGDGDGQNPLSCGDSRCKSSGFACTDLPVVASCCGDLQCGGIEDAFNCEVDCGPPPVCGDLVCDPTEDSCSCTGDCGVSPGSEVGLCGDTVDNDCDGFTDCSDSDCSGDAICQQCIPTHTNEKGSRCSDGKDNDCDGLIDGNDPDC
ncbi:MAG: NEW3 domain-containing protein [Thermodesulfobacteriota bacterium]